MGSLVLLTFRTSFAAGRAGRLAAATAAERLTGKYKANAHGQAAKPYNDQGADERCHQFSFQNRQKEYFLALPRGHQVAE